MKKAPLPFLVSAVVILLAFIMFAIWGIPYFLQPPSFEQSGSAYGSQIIRARVTEILEEGQIKLGENPQAYQVLLVELLEGKYQGILIEVDYGKRQLRNDDYAFSPGDEMYVQLGMDLDGVLTAYYVDYVRTKPLLILLGIFILATILLGRWKGVGSLLALAFTMLMIIGYIVPHILSGEDPLRVSLIGSTIMLGTTLYLTYGWNIKTHASVLSVVLALLLTGLLSILFVSLTRLTGSGEESSLFLIQFSEVTINLRGLLLGGMLIGALGVLDDLVSSQSAAVFEIHDANPSLTFRQIFEGSMRIGRDHVAATVNTLVLAYTGASLPLLLLFTLGSGRYGVLLNAGFVSEEIVRMLVGSLGLIAAVPITSFIATTFVLHGNRLGEWQVLLGSRTGNGEHRHPH
ncbi:MAG TPA: YibE/F family protein [Anaerolineales bacterium]|nr:YibE/F family protein [Anaerolineales bacterium]